MTEPIQGVIRTGGVERRSTTQERLRRLYHPAFRHEEEAEEDDLVDISEEARKRADGTYRKSILEHLNDKDDEEKDSQVKND